MPLNGLSSEDGTQTMTWADIREDLARASSVLAPCDPALLSFLCATQESRSGLPAMQVTASEAGKGVRQIWLERTAGYYQKPSSMIAAVLGTMRHALMLSDQKDFIIEKRFEHPDLGSAQIDSYYIPTGTLSDLKTLKTFKIKMMLGDFAKEGRDYILQMNHQRMCVELAGYPVKEMHLMVLTVDCDSRNAASLAKITACPQAVRMDVPRLPDEEVVAHYKGKSDGLRAAMVNGTADMCTPEETWNGKKCTGGWCPVAAICFELAKK